VDGVKGSELKDRMADLQNRKDALLKQLEVAAEPPRLLHPSIADLYRSKVEELASALQREDTRLQASEMLRGLIDSIVLIPDEGQLRIELRGNLAAMLTAAQQTKRSPDTGDLLVPVQIGCGGSQPTLSAALAPCGMRRHAERKSASRILDLLHKSPVLIHFTN
jgi:hypothetical protein